MTSTATSTAPARFGFRLVTPLVASAVLNPINSTLIAVALVPIGQSFGAGPGRTAWLISALYLATAVGQPVVGLLVDRYGARRVLLSGAAVVMAAGIAGLVPVSVGWLTGVRAVLGIGTCAGFPAAMAVLRKHADAAGQGVPARVLSVLSLSSQTVMVIGPTLGGVLIGLFGWPAIFAVNIPLAGISLLLAVFWVPKDAPARPAGERPEPIDVLGIVLFSLALLVLLCYLMAPGIGDLWLLAVAAAVGAAFARRELRVRHPFIDLRMLAANRAILRTYLRQSLSFMAIYAIMFGYVQWLEEGRGFTESVSGLLLLPMSAVAVGAAAMSGRATGVRARLLVVAVALLGGSVTLLFVTDRTWLGALLGLVALFGLAQGLTSVANQTTLYREAPAETMGTASGLFRTAQYLGAIVAATVIAQCYGGHADSGGLHRLGLVLIVVSALLLVVTVADRGLRRTARAERS
ncbi:Predicted arabinose efflux permease, MFS family [Amycolatopsis saalfeldensis]|uniref:Predicted arabinose efflux permease, MFS family n=1 Tax=Amycolatopsis saalfeldensis TaxID=394193 RepID=A0A1H8Y1C4_9PSEU|nr:Predicted arabinose efflux permease, MFS family [Amycolatopsis saalfeldensis]